MHSDQRTLQSIELPDNFATALRELTTDGEPPATLADAVEAFDRLWDLAGTEVAVEDMFQSELTRHTVDLGHRVEHVPCVLDALIVAIVVESEPVEIRSKQPDDETTIQLTVTDDEVEVEPSSAVFTFGVAETDVREPDPSVLEGTDSVVMDSCSYINAFRDPAAYERWEDQLIDANAMRMSPETLTAVAERAAEDWVVVKSQ